VRFGVRSRRLPHPRQAHRRGPHEGGGSTTSGAGGRQGECPQLVEGDMRVLNRWSGFDPLLTLQTANWCTARDDGASAGWLTEGNVMEYRVSPP
jgi:hypothetical protein